MGSQEAEASFFTPPTAPAPPCQGLESRPQSRAVHLPQAAGRGTNSLPGRPQLLLPPSRLCLDRASCWECPPLALHLLH